MVFAAAGQKLIYHLSLTLFRCFVMFHMLRNAIEIEMKVMLPFFFDFRTKDYSFTPSPKGGGAENANILEIRIIIMLASRILLLDNYKIVTKWTNPAKDKFITRKNLNQIGRP